MVHSGITSLLYGVLYTHKALRKNSAIDGFGLIAKAVQT